MHTLTSKRVVKFVRDFGFTGTEAEQFERYVAANYLFQYVRDNVDLIERSVLGGGSDEGIDIAAVVVNGRIVFEPEEIDFARRRGGYEVRHEAWQCRPSAAIGGPIQPN